MPADTTNFFIAGYAVILGMIVLYAISIGLRKRRIINKLNAIYKAKDGNFNEVK